MSKNPANDNGLENSVPIAIQTWYHCEYEIKKLKKQQESCSKNVGFELANAKEHGYTDDEIKKLIGKIRIPAWFLIDKL